jgi:hypothetical protein
VAAPFLACRLISRHCFKLIFAPRLETALLTGGYASRVNENLSPRPWQTGNFTDLLPFDWIQEEMTLASAFMIADNSVKSDHSRESGSRRAAFKGA